MESITVAVEGRLPKRSTDDHAPAQHGDPGVQRGSGMAANHQAGAGAVHKQLTLMSAQQTTAVTRCRQKELPARHIPVGRGLPRQRRTRARAEHLLVESRFNLPRKPLRAHLNVVARRAVLGAHHRPPPDATVQTAARSRTPHSQSRRAARAQDIVVSAPPEMPSTSSDRPEDHASQYHQRQNPPANTQMHARAHK